jgi:hypothetical protein
MIFRSIRNTTLHWTLTKIEDGITSGNWGDYDTMVPFYNFYFFDACQHLFGNNQTMLGYFGFHGGPFHYFLFYDRVNPLLKTTYNGKITKKAVGLAIAQSIDGLCACLRLSHQSAYRALMHPVMAVNFRGGRF